MPVFPGFLEIIRVVVFKHINESIAQAVGFGKMPGKKR